MLTAFVLPVLLATSIALPGGPPVGMDYLAYDSANGRVWVPAGNTGQVDVIDTATGKVTTLGGFPTKPSPRAGRPAMGPSSVTVAGGVVWVGNRADDRICSFDGRTLAKGGCVQLAGMPDGLAYVAGTQEIWVTTPRDNTITIVDATAKKKTETEAATEAAHAGKAPAPVVIKLEGSPEGYAVDQARGVFYTNLEDMDRTLAIDIKTRQVLATWTPGCGAEGPRGLALDGARRLLLIACTDGAVALSLARDGQHTAQHDGQIVGRLKTGGGVDNIDYHAKNKLLYVASAKDGTLTVARVADDGALSVMARLPTAKGARNAVVDAGGTAYVADSAGGRLLVVKLPAP
jgi:DNA-binding beta-propeller fold protein YncE